MNIEDVIPEYLKYMQAVNRSPVTIKITRFALLRFVRYLEGEQITEIDDLSREVLEEYQQELAFSFTAKGKPLGIRTQEKQLCTVKVFTRFLRDHDYLMHDPGEAIKLPKQPKRLPRSILTHKEVKQLLAAPNMQTNTGYRDRVLLEILYDTAIRRAELSGITVTDLDLDAGYVKVLGKGDKERVVPLSKKVCELITNYLLAVRPALVRGEDNGRLLLNDKGGPLLTHTIYRIIKLTAKKAKIKKNITTHTFRHTCVTHMLKNGAPIRHLQEMLGHESLQSTQIYTHVTINDLKEIHAKYHPSNKDPEKP
jgi:integrase/recombinase XerD